MAKKSRRRRPRKVIMEAVNAKLAGRGAEASRLIKEHKLDRAEIQARIDLRAGRPYAMKSLPRRKKPVRHSTRQVRRAPNLLQRIDATTGIATLLRIEQRVQELLEQKAGEEVSKARAALANVDEYRKKVEEAEALLGELA